MVCKLCRRPWRIVRVRDVLVIMQFQFQQSTMFELKVCASDFVHPQRQGQTMGTVEIPQLQFLDKFFVGVGVLQYIDKVVDAKEFTEAVGKFHVFIRECESGSRVAPRRWTLFLRASCSGSH